MTFWRLLRWLVVGIGLTFVLVILAAVIYLRSESFTTWVREQGVAVVNDSIRGTLSVERLEGSVWRRLTLFNVALRYEEIEILRIPRVDVAFSLFPLIRGRLEISQVDALKPQADLRQNRDGNWNVVEAFAPRQPEPEQSSAFTTVVRSLRLRDAGIDLRIAGEKAGEKEETLYHARNLNLEGGIGLLPEGVSLEVRELASAFASPGLPDLNLKGALDYRQLAGAPPTFKFNDLWAVSRNSRLKLDGEIVQGGALQVKARARIDQLAPADLAYFVSDWPLRRDLAGEFAVEGALADLHGSLNLAGADAKLAAKLRANVEQSPPRYSATMTIAGFDLRQWLAQKDLAGVIAGNLEARGNGFALRDIAAKTELEIRSTEIHGWALGTIAVQGRLEKSVAVVDGRLDGKAGVANWSGKVALQGKRPTYEASIALKDFDPGAASGDSSGLKGKLNLQGTVQGAGFSLADMNTRTDVRVLPSSVGSINVTDGRVEAALRDRRIAVARASLRTAESTLTMNGELGIDRGSAGKLVYRFQSADIAPWLLLANQKGSGSINVAGQARGNLADIETQGAIQLAGLKAAGVAAKSGDVNFTLRGAADGTFPEGVVTLKVTDFDAGLSLRRLDGRATLARAPVQSIDLDLTAQDRADRKHAIKSLLSFAPDGPVLRVNQLSATAPDGAWRLARPATLSQRGDTFVIEQLSLRNGERAVNLDGQFGFAGKQDLRLEVDRLPLETVAGFLAGAPKMTGLIAARAQIGGSAAAPEITANLKLSDPNIAGQSYAGANAEANYKDKRAALRLSVQQDATHSLTVNGTAPLALSWQNQWRAEPGDGMELRARSAGLSVAFLNAFTGKTAENIAGEFELDLVARGSLKQPDLRGSYRLRDGRVRVVPTGVDITGITLAGNLDSRNLIVRELSARAKEGEIRGSGSLALKDYEIGAAKIALNARRWPAIDTSRYQLRVGGNLEVQGTINAPEIKGRIDVAEGSLRPDLAFLEQSKAPVKRDETIAVVRNGVPVAPTPPKNGAQAAEGSVFDNLILDIALRAPGNVWIRHSDLVSELSGNVRVTKAKLRDIDLTGRVDVVRGWFALQGRRFQLARGAIEFTGGDKINPSLDIVAQYKLPEYEVSATIGGTVEKPSLTLASQPRLEQADILALLLFGRPMNTLNQSEQGSLQQSAINITSGYVAGRIASSVSTALGLDHLGIDIREVDFSGGRVGFGRYVGSKTYVSVSQQLSGEQGREVGLEYDVARDWKIGTSTSSTGSNGIDIIWHKRY
jgi:autotransporter translocation and assembly factor TamB